MDTLPSTSEGIYEEAYGGKRPQACCPRAGYLHPTAEDSTSADPPGHHLSLPGPAGRFKSDQQMAEGTSSSSSEGIYVETCGDKESNSCCPPVGYLHPSPEESTSADPPGRHLCLGKPANRFMSDQRMAVRTSSSSPQELCEETHVKRPRACCPRAGYLRPTAEESTSADPPDHHLSLSGPAGRFKSDQQMAVTTSSSPSLESCEETHVKRPKACCPRAGYLHPSKEENTSADSPGHHLSLSGPAGRSQSDQQLTMETSPPTSQSDQQLTMDTSPPSSQSDQQLTMDTSPPTSQSDQQLTMDTSPPTSQSDQQLTMDTSLPSSEGTYDQLRKVRCPPVVYLRFPPEHNTSADPAGGQLSVSRPKSSTF